MWQWLLVQIQCHIPYVFSSFYCHMLIYGVGGNIATELLCESYGCHWKLHWKSLKWYVTVGFLRLFGSILHGVDPLSYFSFQPVLHDWFNKGRGMYFFVCGMMHIKEPLLLIGKSRPCGGSGFPHSLSEWSFTICPTPCNRCVVK